jgi:hypothetical protein
LLDRNSEDEFSSIPYAVVKELLFPKARLTWQRQR